MERCRALHSTGSRAGALGGGSWPAGACGCSQGQQVPSPLRCTEVRGGWSWDSVRRGKAGWGRDQPSASGVCLRGCCRVRVFWVLHLSPWLDLRMAQLPCEHQEALELRGPKPGWPGPRLEVPARQGPRAVGLVLSCFLPSGSGTLLLWGLPGTQWARTRVWATGIHAGQHYLSPRHHDPRCTELPKATMGKDGRETGAEPVPREGRREVRTHLCPPPDLSITCFSQVPECQLFLRDCAAHSPWLSQSSRKVLAQFSSSVSLSHWFHSRGSDRRAWLCQHWAGAKESATNPKPGPDRAARDTRWTQSSTGGREASLHWPKTNRASMHLIQAYMASSSPRRTSILGPKDSMDEMP